MYDRWACEWECAKKQGTFGEGKESKHFGAMGGGGGGGGGVVYPLKQENKQAQAAISHVEFRLDPEHIFHGCMGLWGSR